MPDPVYYFDQADLENALGKSAVATIFDDDGDGIPETSAITACRAYGTAECNSFLRGVYRGDLPVVPTPDELRFAALDFGCAYAMRRRPEAVRAMGEESWTTFRDSAIEKMKRFVRAEQRLPAEPIGQPANVGATVRADDPRRQSEIERGDRRGQGTWNDMGDF